MKGYWPGCYIWYLENRQNLEVTFSVFRFSTCWQFQNFSCVGVWNWKLACYTASNKVLKYWLASPSPQTSPLTSLTWSRRTLWPYPLHRLQPTQALMPSFHSSWWKGWSWRWTLAAATSPLTSSHSGSRQSGFWSPMLTQDCTARFSNNHTI